MAGDAQVWRYNKHNPAPAFPLSGARRIGLGLGRLLERVRLLHHLESGRLPRPRRAGALPQTRRRRRPRLPARLPHARRAVPADRYAFSDWLLIVGGRGEIRTHGTLAGTPVFKTGALNHSATLPRCNAARRNPMVDALRPCKRASLWVSGCGGGVANVAVEPSIYHPTRQEFPKRPPQGRLITSHWGSGAAWADSGAKAEFA